MTLRHLLLLSLSFLLFISCNKDDDPVFDNYVKTVTVNTAAGNVLRVPIDLTFHRDCRFSVTYWTASDKSDAVTTQVTESSGLKATKTLMMLKAKTTYNYQVNIEDGGKTATSPVEQFTTESLPAGVPTYYVTVDKMTRKLKGYLMQWQASTPGYITFCDTEGNVVWYEKFDQPIRMAYMDSTTRTIAVLTGFRDGVSSKQFQRLCDKIIVTDLYGNRSVDWTASAENVAYPHHDIKIMPDGNLLLVNNVTRTFDLSSVGGAAGTEVYGDGFTVISPKGAVLKTWNAFDDVDPIRDNGYLSSAENWYDLLHANSVNWDSEGNYYMTFNRLNELWKIDKTTGKVLYRVGPQGNITLQNDHFPSGIHSAQPLAPNEILCFDNGSNVGQSRAIIYKVDPVAKTARVTMAVTIPSEFSSIDRSNVQLLGSTMLMFGSTMGRACVFTDLSGNILKVIKRGGISYRTYYYEQINY